MCHIENVVRSTVQKSFFYYFFSILCLYLWGTFLRVDGVIRNHKKICDVCFILHASKHYQCFFYLLFFVLFWVFFAEICVNSHQPFFSWGKDLPVRSDDVLIFGKVVFVR